MKKHIVVLGLLLSQSSAMFASVEDVVVATEDNIVATEEVAADSAVAAPVIIENELPLVQEVAIADSVIDDELNDIIEMSPIKPLPEYRETTIGVSIAGGAAFYTSKPINNRVAPCFRGGLNFDVPIGQWFSLQPELLFATRGGGYTTDLDYKLKENLFYFDVPINCKLSKRMNFSSATTGRAFVSVGPVLSFGVYGVSKTDDLVEFKRDEANGMKNKLFQNDPDEELEHPLYRNFDFSLNFRLGYDFDNGYSISAGYQMGLVNLMNDSNFDANEKEYYGWIYGSKFPTVRNNSLYVCLAYHW